MKKALLFFGALGLLLQGAAMGGEMIEVGKKAPAVELKDTDAKAYSLTDQVKKGPVVLVFFRSGDW